MNRHFNVALLASAVLALLLGGCEDKPEAPKVENRKGRITKIDPSSEILTGRFYIEEQQMEMVLSGKLTSDAEIIINGRTATLEDLRIDDPVEVTGWAKKHNGERKLIARRIVVTRPLAETDPAETQSAPGSESEAVNTADGTDTGT